jgi:hypothetical protein
LKKMLTSFWRAQVEMNFHLWIKVQ